MIVKKFQADTETEAILKAKEELGSSAVVLNVKTLKQRGIFRLFRKDVVEITAALEENEFIGNMRSVNAPDATTANVQQPKADAGKQIASGSRFSAVADEKIDVVNDSAVIEEKLDSLHNMLSQQIKKESAASSSAAKAYEEIAATQTDDNADGSDKSKDAGNGNFKYLRLIYNKLVDNEVDEKYANTIINEVSGSIKKEASIDSLLSCVYQKLILKLGEAEPIEHGDKTKVVMLIGPTGVGKTTTIAKLASYFKLEKHCSVAFITADTYRIAAVEQLNTYASIIECPVSVVYAADEMETAINDFVKAGYDMVFIDTAGRSHKNEEQMLELHDMLDRAAKLSDQYEFECFLTLSATTKYRDMLDITRMYKDIPNYRLIITKLDETCAYGNILNVRMATGVKLSYTTMGQDVPNDIELINEQAVARQLLGG